MRIAIIAALQGELKPLVKGWRCMPVSQPKANKWSSSGGDDVWLAVCAGMGARAAIRAFAEAESDGPLDLVLSVGWAGALQQGTCAGELLIPDLVIDAQTGERLALTSERRNCVLVTTAEVAGVVEKQRLADAYDGAMVDMESATVVRLAQMRGIPVCCIKAITDEAGATLPDLNPYINNMGHLRMLPFIAYVAVRPRYWRALIHLGRSSSQGAHSLASAICNIIFSPSLNIAEVIRTGTIPDW